MYQLKAPPNIFFSFPFASFAFLFFPLSASRTALSTALLPPSPPSPAWAVRRWSRDSS